MISVCGSRVWGWLKWLSGHSVATLAQEAGSSVFRSHVQAEKEPSMRRACPWRFDRPRGDARVSPHALDGFRFLPARTHSGKTKRMERDRPSKKREASGTQRILLKTSLGSHFH